MIRAYLDNNATTRTAAEVVSAMTPYLRDHYINPSSAAGRVLGLDRVLSSTKQSVARLLGGVELAAGIVFTSGASESNSWAIASATTARPGCNVVTSAIEHTSVLSACRAAEKQGHGLRVLGCDANGIIDREQFEHALNVDTGLVSIMLANNETGAIQNVADFSEIVRAKSPHAIIHCDITQAVGRVAVDLVDELWHVDLASFSAHKFHGPKGIGGLFIRPGTPVSALIHGEQERGLRGGTFNVLGAVGMGAAADLAAANLADMERVRDLRDRTEMKLVSVFTGSVVNSSTVNRLPNTISIRLPGVDAVTLVDMLATKGICVANGSACTAGSDAPSHVLTAMGLSYEAAFQTIRISLAHDTTEEAISDAVANLIDCVEGQLTSA
jgi:cysteine desulfurase